MAVMSITLQNATTCRFCNSSGPQSLPFAATQGLREGDPCSYTLGQFHDVPCIPKEWMSSLNDAYAQNVQQTFLRKAGSFPLTQNLYWPTQIAVDPNAIVLNSVAMVYGNSTTNGTITEASYCISSDRPGAGPDPRFKPAYAMPLGPQLPIGRVALCTPDGNCLTPKYNDDGSIACGMQMTPFSANQWLVPGGVLYGAEGDNDISASSQFRSLVTVNYIGDKVYEWRNGDRWNGMKMVNLPYDIFAFVLSESNGCSLCGTHNCAGGEKDWNCNYGGLQLISYYQELIHATNYNVDGVIPRSDWIVDHMYVQPQNQFMGVYGPAPYYPDPNAKGCNNGAVGMISAFAGRNDNPQTSGKPYAQWQFQYAGNSGKVFVFITVNQDKSTTYCLDKSVASFVIKTNPNTMAGCTAFIMCDLENNPEKCVNTTTPYVPTPTINVCVEANGANLQQCPSQISGRLDVPMSIASSAFCTPQSCRIAGYPYHGCLPQCGPQCEAVMPTDITPYEYEDALYTEGSDVININTMQEQKNSGVTPTCPDGYGLWRDLTVDLFNAQPVEVANAGRGFCFPVNCSFIYSIPSYGEVVLGVDFEGDAFSTVLKKSDDTLWVSPNLVHTLAQGSQTYCSLGPGADQCTFMNASGLSVVHNVTAIGPGGTNATGSPFFMSTGFTGQALLLPTPQNCTSPPCIGSVLYPLAMVIAISPYWPPMSITMWFYPLGTGRMTLFTVMDDIGGAYAYKVVIVPYSNSSGFSVLMYACGRQQCMSPMPAVCDVLVPRGVFSFITFRVSTKGVIDIMVNPRDMSPTPCAIYDLSMGLYMDNSPRSSMTTALLLGGDENYFLEPFYGVIDKLNVFASKLWPQDIYNLMRCNVVVCPLDSANVTASSTPFVQNPSNGRHLLQASIVDPTYHFTVSSVGFDNVNAPGKAGVQNFTYSSSAMGVMVDQWSYACLWAANAPSYTFCGLSSLGTYCPSPAPPPPFPAWPPGSARSGQAFMITDTTVPIAPTSKYIKWPPPPTAPLAPGTPAKLLPAPTAPPSPTVDCSLYPPTPPPTPAPPQSSFRKNVCNNCIIESIKYPGWCWFSLFPSGGEASIFVRDCSFNNLMQMTMFDGITVPSFERPGYLWNIPNDEISGGSPSVTINIFRGVYESNPYIWLQYNGQVSPTDVGNAKRNTPVFSGDGALSLDYSNYASGTSHGSSNSILHKAENGGVIQLGHPENGSPSCVSVGKNTQELQIYGAVCNKTDSAQLWRWYPWYPNYGAPSTPAQPVAPPPSPPPPKRYYTRSPPPPPPNSPPPPPNPPPPPVDNSNGLSITFPLSVSVWMLIRDMTAGAPIWDIGMTGNCCGRSATYVRLSAKDDDKLAATVTVSTPTGTWKKSVSSVWLLNEWMNIVVVVSGGTTMLYVNSWPLTNNMTITNPSGYAAVYGNISHNAASQKWTSTFIGAQQVCHT